MSKKSGKPKTDYPKISLDKAVEDYNFDTATLVIPERLFVRISSSDADMKLHKN